MEWLIYVKKNNDPKIELCITLTQIISTSGVWPVNVTLLGLLLKTLVID